MDQTLLRLREVSDDVEDVVTFGRGHGNREEEPTGMTLKLVCALTGTRSNGKVGVN